MAPTNRQPLLGRLRAPMCVRGSPAVPRSIRVSPLVRRGVRRSPPARTCVRLSPPNPTCVRRRQPEPGPLPLNPPPLVSANRKSRLGVKKNRSRSSPAASRARIAPPGAIRAYFSGIIQGQTSLGLLAPIPAEWLYLRKTFAADQILRCWPAGLPSPWKKSPTPRNWKRN